MKPPKIQTCRFPEHVFLAEHPAQLKQGDWLANKEFLELLEESWVFQYAQYLGQERALALLKKLRREGRLYDHHEALTLHAWIGEHLVGVTALRPLEGIDLITMLEVHPQYRGSGIGTQLLQALCAASECLVAHVSLYQPRVKAFYSRQGFKLLQRDVVQHGCYKLDFDVMALRTNHDSEQR